MSHADAHHKSDHEPTVAELEADIERNRHELGETVEALSAKLDVKGQLKSQTEQARTTIVDGLAANWRELAIVTVYAALVTVVWKKM